MEKLRRAAHVMRCCHGHGPMPGRPMGPCHGHGPAPFGGPGPMPGPGPFPGPAPFPAPAFGPGPGTCRKHEGPFPPRPEHGGKPCGHRGFPRERILLTVLDMGGSGARQKDIAEKLGIGPSSLSEQIDRLEADRYIERIPNPDDGRSTLIALTEKGRARAYEVSDERRERAESFCGRLTDEEKETLIVLLGKLLGEQE